MSAAARDVAGLRPERGRAKSVRPTKRLSKREQTDAKRASRYERQDVSIAVAERAASDQAATDLLDVERIRFIRETAQLLFIRSRDPVSGTPARNPLSADECWTAARVLWTAKPEGC